LPTYSTLSLSAFK